MRRSALLLFLLASAACTRKRVVVAPAPAPLPPDTAAAPAPATPGMIADPIRFCVVRDGHLEMVEGEVTPKGDSLYLGQPIKTAFPADSTYALNARWYTNSEPLDLLGDHYLKYGLPRILGTADVVPITIFRGVSVFAEPRENPAQAEIVYLPTRPGCEFQPYTRLGVK